MKKQQPVPAFAETEHCEDDVVAVHAVELPQFDETFYTTHGSTKPTRSLDIVGDVKVTLDIRLGSTVMSIADLMALAPGSVVELDRHLGDSVDVLLNERLIGNGEIVAVGEYFGVRMTEFSHDSARL
ncbi:flagellar motor switch protein FliN [Caballeronia telluris]|uniref:Flagellar motor switch protein FliN n=1 Tax=Caballeronia telluris TaxID=326475 RepID=A0A158ESW4_9BURK|nr:flagellar motor switch protein FliN [Caballeronia telluris]SAL10606.1 flagellar motor switch protein [Caballeronia telluris]